MGRKFIFRHNRTANTNICASKQQPTTDKSAEAQQAERVPLSNETSDPNRSLVQCLTLPDYRTHSNQTRTVAAGLSSASREDVQEDRRSGRAVEKSCQTCLSNHSSNDIPKLRSNAAHSPSADNTATPPPTDRVPLSNETSDPFRSLVKCNIVADYRTVVDDLLKFVEFIDWLHDNYPELLPLHSKSL